MKQILSLLITIILVGCSPRVKKPQENLSEEDSTKIANSSLGFYNWYLGCLEADSTYNIVQPQYHWKDTIPILDVDIYFSRLEKLGVASEIFIKSEIERFKLCQDSLYNIDHVAVDSCGCSVGEFYEVCNFLDYLYWIGTQEKYNGCDIKSLSINKDLSVCEIKFYYQLDKQKSYDDSFISKIFLKKYEYNWLIDSIVKQRI